MLGYFVSRFNIFNKEYNAPLAHNENVVQSVIPNIVRVNQMKNVQYEGLALFERKNKDYGDAFARYGTIGVLMRMGDKISRLQSITKNGIVLVNDEQMRDTLIDLHNYSAMAIMLLDEGKEMNIEYGGNHQGINPCSRCPKSTAECMNLSNESEQNHCKQMLSECQNKC